MNKHLAAIGVVTVVSLTALTGTAPACANESPYTASIDYDTDGWQVMTVTGPGASVSAAVGSESWDDVLADLGYQLVPCGCWSTTDGLDAFVEPR